MKKRFPLHSYITIFSIVLLFSMPGNLFSEGEPIADKLFTKPKTGDRLLPLIAAVGQSQDEIRASIGIIVNQEYLNNNSNTISTFPGNYILSENVNGPINIAIDNVSLDLNGYTIAPGSGNVGIDILEEASNVTIKNGYIVGEEPDPSGNFASPAGIEINQGSDIIKIENLNISNFLLGISFDENKACKVKDCIVENCSIGVDADNLLKSTFENVEAKDCVTHGFLIANSNFNTFDSCRALVISSTTNTYGFKMDTCSKNSFYLCKASGITTEIVGGSSDDPVGYAVGFHLEACTNNFFELCQASGIISSNDKNARGFSTGEDKVNETYKPGENNTFKECSAQEITAQGDVPLPFQVAIGFRTVEDHSNFIGCIASNLTGDTAIGIDIRDKYEAIKGIKVTECIVKLATSIAGSFGIRLGAAVLGTPYGVTDCAIENSNIGLTSGLIARGILISSLCENNIVCNNKIYSIGGKTTINAHGIQIKEASQNTIYNNHISDVMGSSVSHGIKIRDSGPSFTAINNIIDMNQVSDTGTGIDSEPNEDDNLITRNRSYNNDYHFCIAGGATPFKEKYNGRGNFMPQKPNSNIYWEGTIGGSAVDACP